VAQLARLVAPQLDEAELRRVVAGYAQPAWPKAPLWRETGARGRRSAAVHAA
jgi:hypothetical protein